MGREFVVMGARLECNHGTTPSNLVVLPTRTVMLTGKFKANIGDCKPLINVLPFGLCKSPANPAVAAAMGTPQPCAPACSTWLVGHTTVWVQGEPALLTDDKAICPLGAGMITVKTSGQGSGYKKLDINALLGTNFDENNLKNIVNKENVDRRSPKKSEDVAEGLLPKAPPENCLHQPSYKKGDDIDPEKNSPRTEWGEKGSIRPDIIDLPPPPPPNLIDVKNYNLKSNRSNLTRCIANQAKKRDEYFPGAEQTFVIDTTGQSITADQQDKVIRKIYSELSKNRFNGTINIIFGNIGG